MEWVWKCENVCVLASVSARGIIDVFEAMLICVPVHV